MVATKAEWHYMDSTQQWVARTTGVETRRLAHRSTLGTITRWHFKFEFATTGGPQTQEREAQERAEGARITLESAKKVRDSQLKARRRCENHT